MKSIMGRVIYAYQGIHRWNFMRKLHKYACLEGDWTIEPTGSRMYCFPPPTGTDQDWLVEVKNKKAHETWDMYLEVCYRHCDKYGVSSYSPSVTEDGKTRFVAYRRGIDNIILTWDPDFARRWRIAHKHCKTLNLQTKQERINCFELCRAGRH